MTRPSLSRYIFLLGLFGTTDSFTATPRRHRLVPTQTSTSLSAVSVDNAQDVVDLVTGASEAFLNIVTNANSPADVWKQLPLPAQGVAAAALVLPVAPTVTTLLKSIVAVVAGNKGKTKKNDGRYGYVSYPEGQPATYELNDQVVPFEFGEAALVRPLLKQTQLETRPLQVVYDANRDGYDARVFHSKVDGKGAAVVLAKVGGTWCGGYNPRGWASLGQARSSVAAFLFYKPSALQSWQKVRVNRTGSMACGNDLYDAGIYFGADSLVVPLRQPAARKISSRLGQYFEERPADGKLTVLPRAGVEYECQELKVLTGVYAPGEDIPNSGGVLELGYY